jgi:serine/threonine-protein kinase
MLTGRKLFDVEGAFAVMRAQVEAVPQPPSTLNPLVPPSLDAIVKKALEKDPAQRFQSADEFRMALKPDAADARTTTEPSVSRKPRFGGMSGGMTALPSSLSGFRVSRTTALLLVPAVLTAGLFAVRYLPSARRRPSAQSPVVGATSIHDTERPSPVVAAQTESAVPEVILPTPSSEGPAAEAATVSTPPLAKSPKRPAVARQPDTALRITGGESLPVSPIAPLRQGSAQLLEPVDSPKSSAFAPSGIEPPEPVTAEVPSVPSPAVNETPPASRPNVGSRLVRALGRVNPLRLMKKDDATQNQVKQR